MENFLEYLKKHYLILICILILIIIGIFQIIILSKDESLEIKNNDNSENIIAYEPAKEENNSNKISVDIKGAIKKPGVYEMEENDTINDVIKKAGGLLKTATTIDINLSKIVSKEMVIYISTTSEYKNRNKFLNTCNCSNQTEIKKEDTKTTAEEVATKDIFVKDYNNTTANEVILPNNPIKNDESKASDTVTSDEKVENNTDNENGLININTADKEKLQNITGIGASKAEKIIEYRNNNGLFKSIEDIKNVSGIGDSLYEKIKDYITV